MFNIFKRKAKTDAKLSKAAVSEADFDIIHDLVLFEVTLTKEEQINLFLQWSQNARGMSLKALGNMVVNQCHGFQSRFTSSILAEKITYGTVFAQKLVDKMLDEKLIEPGRSNGNSDYQISLRGEQIRQFYVLKKGLRGSIYDRMDRFTAA
ncbi:hypothetical protein LCGC14_0271170 [marine sediment metagenome]|uniref:Uncharacterized protein n=1 Tax=marine sediment metagenome TaxID=412755 RepID=A0A0F9X420_9ZZZZ